MNGDCLSDGEYEMQMVPASCCLAERQKGKRLMPTGGWILVLKASVNYRRETE
jgi:hypothetical protein